MDLIIDVGNTRAKAAVFEKDNLKHLFVFDKNKIILEVKKILKKFQIGGSIISAVSKLSPETFKKLHELLVNLIELNSTTKIPFKNNYGTPNTLGVDRIALASYAFNDFPEKNVLVIDAGTCVTFDFLNSEGEYLGGAISPGLAMRYQSLNNYTSKLPLLTSEVPKSFIGTTTKESIHSGVVNGICREIDGVVTQYKKEYEDLTVLLTGGDTLFLAKQLKNHIFANPNLVLEGLHRILTYNRADD